MKYVWESRLHITPSNQQHYIEVLTLKMYKNDPIDTNRDKFLLHTKIIHIQVQLQRTNFNWYFVKLPTVLTLDLKSNSKKFSTLLYSPQKKKY